MMDPQPPEPPADAQWANTPPAETPVADPRLANAPTVDTPTVDTARAARQARAAAIAVALAGTVAVSGPGVAGSHLVAAGHETTTQAQTLAHTQFPAFLEAGTAAQAAGRPATPPQDTAATLPRDSAFDSARAWEHLRRQVAIGPRPAGSAALNDTRRYIIDHLKSVGVNATTQAFIAKTPLGEMSMGNVIATIPGRSRDRIVLASHFDTKRAPFRFVGANDGASSTAVLLELARVLKSRQNALTIELLFLDGEEAVNWDWGVTGQDNTYGSRYYVEAAKKAKTLDGIKALVLLDMIGETNAVFQRESYSTPWLVDVVWDAARRLGYGSTFVDAKLPVEDDHIAFLKAGVPAMDIIDIDYQQWHTADDDLPHVSAKSLATVGDVVLASLAGIEDQSRRQTK